MENQIELRYATELRADKESGIISGTAIVFNSESNLLGGEFREVILPSAATLEFLQSQDIVMKYNHLEDSILARYRKDGQRNSLNFSVDERGVHFSFRAKKNDAGILESISNGDLDSCSFAFRVSPEPNSEKWEKRNNGEYLRTVSKFSVVRDFSIVISPAYSQTSLSVRGLDELKAQEELKVQEEQKRKADAEKAEADKKIADDKRLQEYHQKYENILNSLKK